jgi:hypothetical protein
MGFLYPTGGHDLPDARNHNVGSQCRACGAWLRWQKVAGIRGLVRQVKQGAEWVTVEREPACAVRSRWSRDQSRG